MKIFLRFNMSLLATAFAILVASGISYGNNKPEVVCNFSSVEEVAGVFTVNNLKCETTKNTEGKNAVTLTAVPENSKFKFCKLTAFGPLTPEEKKTFISSEWEGEYSGKSIFGKMTGDWSRFETLKVNITNNSKKIVNLDISILDDKSGSGYQGRFTTRQVLRPGFNNVEMEIGGMCSENSRALDMKKVKCFWISWGVSDGESLTFDNMRLE